MLTSVGGSPLKPTELVALQVDGPDSLSSSQPGQWRVLRKASNVQVGGLLAI